MDRENDGALPEALAVLTEAIEGTEALDEAEILFTDAVRLATQIGDLSTAQAIARRADLYAAWPEIPHRLAAATLLSRPAGSRRLSAAGGRGPLRRRH